jgi:hypothetical protein
MMNAVERMLPATSHHSIQVTHRYTKTKLQAGFPGALGVTGLASALVRARGKGAGHQLGYYSNSAARSSVPAYAAARSLHVHLSQD